MSSAQAATSAPPASAATPRSLGEELRSLVSTSRLQSLSIHDAQGDAMWLSEGALGPDEYSAVLDGMGDLGLDRNRAAADRVFDDSRSGCFIAIRSPQQDLIGVVMLLLDGRTSAKSLLPKLSSPAVRSVLQRLAIHMKPAHERTVTLNPKGDAADLEAALIPDEDFSRAVDSQASRPSATPAAPRAASATSGDVGPNDATIVAVRPETSDFALFVQQLLKLRSGGRTRRYEVLIRSKKDPSRDAAPVDLLRAIAAKGADSAVDRFVLRELVAWLAEHREVWEPEPASFSINVSAGALRDQAFLRFVGDLLRDSKVEPRVVGFEIAERAFLELPVDAKRFVKECEALGTFVVLDDFTLHSSVLPLLASQALRLVKIDAKLTAAAMQDKLSQAIVIAISQASKVLGVNCVAKRIESSMARQWLAAIGIDFAQGYALERPKSLDALASSLRKSQ